MDSRIKTTVQELVGVSNVVVLSSDAVTKPSYRQTFHFTTPIELVDIVNLPKGVSINRDQSGKISAIVFERDGDFTPEAEAIVYFEFKLIMDKILICRGNHSEYSCDLSIQLPPGSSEGTNQSIRGYASSSSQAYICGFSDKTLDVGDIASLAESWFKNQDQNALHRITLLREFALAHQENKSEDKIRHYFKILEEVNRSDISKNQDVDEQAIIAFRHFVEHITVNSKHTLPIIAKYMNSQTNANSISFNPCDSKHIELLDRLTPSFTVTIRNLLLTEGIVLT